MPQQQTSPSDSQPDPSSDFGANEWLVEEMYDQFTRDPGSVDPTWAAYFEKSGSGNGSGPSNGTAPTAQAPAAQAPAAKAPAERAPAAKTSEGQAPSAGAPAATTVTKPAPRATPRPDSKAAEPAKGTDRPVPKEKEAAAPSGASDQPTYTVLRGAPARTVANMDDSLTVPTATSVRSVPVKLLWDNRIVINNHLSRARGGKVSFTHLIGFAMVKAMRAMPEMNVGFDTVEGSPT